MSLTEPTLPDSPFLPGTSLQFAWDSVSLTAAMACWRRYQYTIIEGLVPKGPARAIALDFGIAFHKALEHYHETKSYGQDHEASVRNAIFNISLDPHYSKLPTHEEVKAEAEATDENDDGIQTRNAKVRTRYHLMRAVVWYLDHYADDPASTIILPSGAPAVELSFRIPIPVEVGGEQAILCGHIDRAVEFNDSYFVVDYKTTKALSRQFFADFELSHQITGYSVAGQVVLDKPISGAIIDGIAVQVGGVQFQRSITKRSPGQIAEYITTVQNTMDEAERHAESGEYPMNTSACYFCHFKALCGTPPEYRNSYKSMWYETRPAWNPLENR